MKRIILLGVLCLTFGLLTAQKNNNKELPTPTLLASTEATTGSVFIGDMRATETLENAGQARKVVMSHIKSARESLDGGKVDASLGDETPTASTDAFTMYLGRLEKKYAASIKAIETDNIRDVFQIDQKTDLKRRYSAVVSAQCLCTKNEGSFIKLKDLDGQEIVGFPLESLRGNSRYGLVENYHQGFARIKKDQVFGFLNVCGDEVIPSQYVRAEPFNDGKALVKKLDWSFVDIKGNESEVLENIINAKPLSRGISLAQFKNTGKVALIDNNYDVSKKPLSDFFDDIEPFYKDELYRVRVGKKYGLLKLDGTLKMEVSYDNLEPTNTPHLMRVSVDGKVGLIDSLGNVRIKPTFDYIGNFNKFGLADARDAEGSRLINLKDLKMSKVYASIGDFDGRGLSIVRDVNQKYGIINRDLQTIKEPIFTSLSTFNQFGLAAVCREIQGVGIKCGYMKYDGSVVIPFSFDEVGQFNRFGLVVVTESLPKCIDTKGPCKTDQIYDRQGNLIIAKTSDASPEKIKYVLLDSVLISRQYIPVRTYGVDNVLSYHLIEKNNMRKITTIPYETIKSYDVNLNFAVRKAGVWGLIDTTGKAVVKCQFKEILNPSEGYYGVRFENGKYGFVDKKGKTQVLPEYEEIRPFYNGLAIVSKGTGKMGLISRFGGKVAPCVFKALNFISNTRQYELTGPDDAKYLLNINGECEGNQAKFEALRKEANQQ